MAQPTLPTTMQFALISPEAKLFDAPVFEVRCPGSEGEFGVRAGHMPLMASLKPGVLYIQEERNAPLTAMFVAGGFADVTAELCTVLAEQAIPLADLNRETLEQEVANAREDINAAADEATRLIAQAALNLAQAKLQAIAA